MTTQVEQTTRYATAAEVREALLSLTDADLARLAKIANARVAGNLFMSGSDLLHEAVERALAGTRRWPRHVRFVTFLANAMKSIAEDTWRKHDRQVAHCGDGGAREDGPIKEAVAREPSPEDAAIRSSLTLAYRKRVEEIKRVFQDDHRVLQIIDGLAAGASREEIITGTGMTATQYASSRRKLRRRLDERFPEGWQSW